MVAPYCVLQVQQILLVADKALNGSFTLSFNGAVTAPLDAQALLWATAGFLASSSAADAAMALETAISALDTVGSVGVTARLGLDKLAPAGPPPSPPPPLPPPPVSSSWKMNGEDHCLSVSSS